MLLLSQIYCVHAEQSNKVLSYFNSYSLVAAAQLNRFNISVLECWFLRVTWFKQYTQINLSSTQISSCSGDNDVQDFFQIKPFTEKENKKILTELTPPSFPQDLLVEMDE